MELVYGTYNPSKFDSMQKTLSGLDIQLIHLNQVNPSIGEAPETGNDPLTNALIKAKAYYQQINRPVFSCDSGLYFEEVTPEHQPGIFIKRVNGSELTDQAMMDYYQNLSKQYGGRLTAYYKNAICLVLSETEVYSYDGAELNSDRFYLADQPHPIVKKGFPLDTLSVDIQTNCYYYDLHEDKNATLGIIPGFRDFFIKVLNLPI